MRERTETIRGVKASVITRFFQAKLDLDESIKLVQILHQPAPGESLSFDCLQPLTRIANLGANLDLHALLDCRTSLLEEPPLLRQQVRAARLGVVAPGSRRVLQRAELFLPIDLQDRHVMRKGEHVEHEQLEFHPIGLGRLDSLSSSNIDVRDLFPRNVEGHLLLELGDAVEELDSVKVVCDVPGAERQLTTLVLPMRLFVRDLRILDDAEASSLACDDTDGFGRCGLWDDFGCAVGVFVDCGTEEDGVCDADEAVVNAISVDVGDISGGKVGEDRGARPWRDGGAEGGIEATVTIRSNGDGGG